MAFIEHQGSLPSVADFARTYIRRRCAPVPIPFGQKGPKGSSWPELRVTEDNVDRYFIEPCNIGIILGSASNGLVDVDIDCQEAQPVADRFLPPTKSVFGRASKPRSHRFYRSSGPMPSMKLLDPVRKDTLVELRANRTRDGGLTSGLQTVLPPSIHPSGERIEWEEDGEPAAIAYVDLRRAVLDLGAQCLIARYCPGAGTPDEISAALDRADPRVRQQMTKWRGEADALAQSPQPSQTAPDYLNNPARGAVAERVAQSRAHERLKWTEHDVQWVWAMLTWISSTPYDVWFKVGAVLYDIEAWPVELRWYIWCWWSVELDGSDPKKFDQAHQEAAWRSYGRPYEGQRAGIGTIYQLAKEARWDGRTLRPLPDQFRRFPPAPGVQPSPAPATQATADALDAATDAELERLASLPPIQYARQREDAAKRLNVPLTWLDKAVTAERAHGKRKGQGHELKLVEPEPWPEPVDGREVVRGLMAVIRSFVVMVDLDAPLVVALWIFHDYVFELFMVTPRLCVYSPEKRCGKTTLLDVIGCLINRPLPTVDITGPALFRTVEKARPTLLFDEADNTFGRYGKAGDGASDILAILNSGHRCGGQVTRTVGEDFEPRAFSTHTPVAMALIGKPPGTLGDRCIYIEMRRKLASEKTESFRYDRTGHLQPLARQVRRWCNDNRQTLAASDPAMPDGVFNRDADNWRPLLAVADLIGFGAEARGAAARFIAERDETSSISVMMLGDCRQAFEELQAEQLGSDRLVAYLKQLEGRPWAEWHRGKGITTHTIVQILAPFGIKPEEEALFFSDWRHVLTNPPVNSTAVIRKRGYLRTRFEDAWRRYLSSDEGQPQATPQLETGVTYEMPDHLRGPRRQVGPLSIVGM
jgi:hypothetical protein